MHRPARLLPLLAAASVVACAPLRRREAAATMAAVHAAERAVLLASPPPALPPPASDPFFAGAEELATGFAAVPPTLVAEPGKPWVRRYLPLEGFVRRQANDEGRRDVRTLYAFVCVAHVPQPPARAADAILDAAREQAALDADELTLLARVPSAAGERAAFGIAMLRMGEGPFREDFRWDLQVARRDRADGSVLLRYERSTARGPALHVSVFRGAGVLTPEGDGSRWIEVMVVASEVTAPFFLAGKVEGAVGSLLARRWKRLSQ